MTDFCFLEYGQLEMNIFFVIVIGQIQVNLQHQHFMKHYMLVVHMQSKRRFLENDLYLFMYLLVIIMNYFLSQHIQYYYLDKMYRIICKILCYQHGK
jgi:hypothetical protein